MTNNRINVIKSGNWSDNSIWPGETLPSLESEVYLNGNSVIIDVNIQVKSISNERTYSDITAGNIEVLDNITIKSDLISDTVPLLNFNKNYLKIEGRVYGAKSSAFTPCINNTSNGTIEIVGAVFGGNGEKNYGINNLCDGTIIVNGYIYYGRGSNSFALYNDTNGKIIINGEEFTEQGGYGTD